MRGYYPLLLITETHGVPPERYFTLACGHTVPESYMDKPHAGYLRCRFCPTVAQRPVIPTFSDLGKELSHELGERVVYDLTEDPILASLLETYVSRVRSFTLMPNAATTAEIDTARTALLAYVEGKYVRPEEERHWWTDWYDRFASNMRVRNQRSGAIGQIVTITDKGAYVLWDERAIAEFFAIASALDMLVPDDAGNVVEGMPDFAEDADA